MIQGPTLKEIHRAVIGIIALSAFLFIFISVLLAELVQIIRRAYGLRRIEKETRFSPHQEAVELYYRVWRAVRRQEKGPSQSESPEAAGKKGWWR